MSVLGTFGTKRDLQMRAGTDFGPIVVSVINNDGTVFPLTGATVRAQLRKTPQASGSPVASFDCVVVNGAAGQFTLALGRAVTAAIPSGPDEFHPDSVYAWDCEAEIGGQVIPLLYGRATVRPEVTR